MDWVPRLSDLFLAVSVAGILLLLVAFARGIPDDSIDLGDVIGGPPDLARTRGRTRGEPA